MSAYPIGVKRLMLEHKGGTKFYEITMIDNCVGRGNSLVVFRWGKVGTYGDIQVHQVSSLDGAEDLRRRKRYEKEGRGYRAMPSPASRREIFKREELAGVVGPLIFSRLGAENVNFIDPDFDTTGMKAAEKPKRGENFEDLTYEDMAARKREFEEEARRQEQSATESFYQNNPNYGAF